VSQVPGLYSPLGFQTAWTDYQQFLTQRLSALTVGTANETRFPFYITLNTSKDQTQQRIFNVASQAHNNHFFFQQLGESGNHTRPSRTLEARINEQFGSLEGLKALFVDASDSLVGQGWVFLVESADKKLDLLVLNNSGTPYAFNANQSLDLNGPIDKDDYEALEAMKQDLRDGVQDYTLPLIGISLWDQSYLVDYGIDGKKQYVEKVFECLNWDVINKRVFQL
jgi:Fe-Mn family superoxide dismutase